MRIPKIYKRDESYMEHDIKYIDLTSEQLDPVIYVPDVDFDDFKSVKRYIKSMKSMIRSSNEYRKLMQFLKTKCEMNKCFFLPKVKKYRDSHIKIELHHTGFVLEDLIEAVLRKRYANDEDYGFQSIAEELMLEHYKGNIALTALSSTLHDLIHEENSNLFIPIHMTDFGNMNNFYDKYKDYIPEETKKKFESYKTLSSLVENIEDFIPEYLDVNYIYYRKQGIDIPDMDKILEIIDLR
jgi:hypothetical protein